MSGTSEMEATNITASNISKVLKRAQNWKAPGLDMMHNFLFKHLTCVYLVLAKCIQNIISNPELATSFMLEGITYMLPKNQMSTVFQTLDRQPVLRLFISSLLL